MRTYAWLMVLGATGLGCHPGGGGGGGATVVVAEGDPCTAAEAESESGDKICAGDVQLECYADEEAGEATPSWHYNKDCREGGEVCRDRECVDAASVPDGGAGAGACPDIGGRWIFGSHCDPEQVGEDYTVTQTGCNFVVDEPAWAGTVSATGGLAFGGLGSDGEIWGCTGTATGGTSSGTCQSGSCPWQATRQ